MIQQLPEPVTTDLFAQALNNRLRAILEAARDVCIPAFKTALEDGTDLFYEGFNSGAPVEDLVRYRARFVDTLLIRSWRHFVSPDAGPAALIAVGGYGRGMLLPHSDIDLLILHAEGDVGKLAAGVEGLLTFLWDIGLVVGHSVRSPTECGNQAARDVTTLTNMMEARLLAGDTTLMERMQAAISPSRVWPSADYFRAKRSEQHDRHAHYGGSVYTLEPSIKESPGGLRDIQAVVWIANRHLQARSLADLLGHGFLNESEYHSLQAGRAYLWRVRFALHMLTGRCEDRLLFDHQIKIARLFGHNDENNNLAVEQFMQHYYRNAKIVSTLNEILMQLFEESILHTGDNSAVPINARFQTRHDLIEVRRDDVFQRQPRALLEIFHLLQLRPEITGIRAQTLRLLRSNQQLIDNSFREDIRNRRLFTDMLRQRHRVAHVLRLMHRHELLGRYLPAFGQIIGHMQYDLFHTLTVDEHILAVISNLRLLLEASDDNQLLLARNLMQRLDKPELLYVAALFHDIAKGRDGDHSKLGVADARLFCNRHGFSSDDTDQICWLVRWHLLMSITAQRRDINDPTVIYDFARIVASRERLDQLYVFTVCDIRGTNPKLWNTWKASLLSTLYHNTTRTLTGGLRQLDEQELVDETRSAAAAILTRNGVPVNAFTELWKRFHHELFLRNGAMEIAWQTQAIIENQDISADGSLVLVDDIGNQGTTVFIYTRDREYLFGLTTGVLAQLGLSIHNARINTTDDGYTLDSYVISDSDGNPIRDQRRCQEICNSLTSAIDKPEVTRIRVTRQRSRRKRHFSVPTQISFRSDLQHNQTVLELVTADFPGLLSTVGEIFRKRDILLDTAKIGTIGERAEDIFHITDSHHQPLQDPLFFQNLQAVLTRALDHMQK